MKTIYDIVKELILILRDSIGLNLVKIGFKIASYDSLENFIDFQILARKGRENNGKQ
jgi:hypothetical protein